MTTIPWLLAAILCAADPPATTPPPAAPPTPATPSAPSSEPDLFGGFPADWFWNIRGSAERFAKLLNHAPPPLKVKDWIGEPQELAKLHGKVVVIDFWATWCHPCMASLPDMNELAKSRAKDGLVVIGVHDSSKASERMPGVAKEKGMAYSMCVDDDGASASAWGVSFWPTIAVIDRAGNVRAVGVTPQHVKDVVEKVLAEK